MLYTNQEIPTIYSGGLGEGLKYRQITVTWDGKANIVDRLNNSLYNNTTSMIPFAYFINTNISIYIIIIKLTVLRKTMAAYFGHIRTKY